MKLWLCGSYWEDLRNFFTASLRSLTIHALKDLPCSYPKSKGKNFWLACRMCWKTQGGEEFGIKANFEIDSILPCVLVSTQSICIKFPFSKAGGEEGKRKVTLWLTLCFIQDVTLPFICKGWRRADAVCNMLPRAKQRIWIEGCARDYILWPSSHFLCLHSLSVGQMSLWGLVLSGERKARGIPEISEPSSSVDLVAQVFWLHTTLKHPSFPVQNRCALLQVNF